MIDAKQLLLVMKDGGSLEEAAAAQDVSVDELITLSCTYPELYTAVLQGVTLCRAWWSKYLRNNSTKTISIDVYSSLMHDMKQIIEKIEEIKTDG